MNVLHRSRTMCLGFASAGLLGLSVLVSACGGPPGSHVAQLGSTTTESNRSSRSAGSAIASALAFSHCMRAHGVPNFPDPSPQGDFPSFDTGVSKQTSVAANDDCRHLLPNRGSTATPQERRQKFAFALEVARCLRAHGSPNFPDPTASGQHIPPGIDTQSPQFQATETACEKQARKTLGLP